MTHSRLQIHRPLLSQLHWFIRLRWVAGLAVLAGSLGQGKWLGWYANVGAMAIIGIAILGYNLVLWLLMGRLYATDLATGAARLNIGRPLPLLALAWAQLLLDLACLTLLTLLTGGIGSPLLGFFVFHMVFASLLLPRQMAYAGAALAMTMLAAGLWRSHQWPEHRQQYISLLAWVVMLLMTVWLANGMTRSLRRQRQRLSRQNRRILAMSQKLRRQQQGMIQHEKMAVAGRMAAGVAHEIANPLAGMDGLLQLMERRPEKDRPDAIHTLREQVARINQIVRRMTEFAHPGSGQRQLLSLNDLVSKAIEVIGFDPRMKRVLIDTQLAAQMPPVLVLADAVQQVILNLVINALDAMEGVDQPRLVVRTSHNQGWCSLTITDNGHGIAAQDQDRLFEPFFTTKPVGKGTGLGLSISYSLVRQMDGDIVVESHPGRGTCFAVQFPAVGQGASHLRERHSGGVATSENG